MLLDNTIDDYDWWCRDQEGYLAEMERRDSIFKNTMKNFMGAEFENTPLPTSKELEESITKQIDRLSKLKKLKAPANILDSEQLILEELLTALKTGNYAVTQTDFDYIKNYNRRQREFFDHNWDFDWVK